MLPGGADPNVSCGDDCALHVEKGQPRHVTVHTRDGWAPGLLTEWRRGEAGWEAWVAFVRWEGGVWVQVRAWVVAEDVRAV